jgi:hypothetical protein
MATYIKPGEPDAWTDFPSVESFRAKAKDYVNWTQECPNCKGRGGWNLKLNAYKLPLGMESTTENRHNFAHFRCICARCNGWGFLPSSDADYSNVEHDSSG